MSEPQETEGRQLQDPPRTGLEILYAKPGPKNDLADLTYGELMLLDNSKSLAEIRVQCNNHADIL